MNKKTLIVYNSRSGSTKTLAQIISRSLADLGTVAACNHITPALDPGRASRVIIATPLFYGKCPDVVTDFLSRHASRLAELEIRLVFTCLRLTGTPVPAPWKIFTDPQLKEPPKPFKRMGMMEKSHSIPHYLDPLEDLFLKIKPDSLAFFKGDLNFSVLDLKSRLVMKLMSMVMTQAAPGSYLDHQCISQWVSALFHPNDLSLNGGKKSFI